MFRFTIRDLLWLMTLVGVVIVWIMDRNAIRQERAKLVAREAELVSRAKMWEAEAHRAGVRAEDANEYSRSMTMVMMRRGIRPPEMMEFEREVRGIRAGEKGK